MTQNGLIVAAPWIIFCAGLAVLCLLLLLPGRTAGGGSRRPSRRPDRLEEDRPPHKRKHDAPTGS